MPPFKPFVSRAQQGKLNAMAERGEISKAEVHGKNEATKGKKLPYKAKHKSAMHKKLYGEEG